DFAATGGTFTVAGVTGTCSYTGVNALTNTLTGLTGCTGTPAQGATVTPVAKGPGVYKWDDSSSSWQLQTVGIPSGTSFPGNPVSNDYFQATKAPSSTTSSTGAIGSSLVLAASSAFPTAGTFTG